MKVRLITTDCKPMEQFQCYDMICIEASEVCDITPQCNGGEDEQQECDKLPASAYCNFENGMCGWKTSDDEKGKWQIMNGQKISYNRVGPSEDHTYGNRSGHFLVARFPPGRMFGFQITFSSPWFPPPPYYHRNVHSVFFNTCQVRFYFHKFGSSMGELRLIAVEADPAGVKKMDLWRSYGNKGDNWWRAVVALPNTTHQYKLEFSASKGMGQSDITIDDVSLSPECFGIGVPEHESIEPTVDTPVVLSDRTISAVKKYVFNTCGATGRFGPNETMCTKAYEGSLTNVTVMNQSPLDGIQMWTVPESGKYTVFVTGAGGGIPWPTKNKQHIEDELLSMGTSIRATFDWEKDDTIFILVGQQGQSFSERDESFIRVPTEKPGGPPVSLRDKVEQVNLVQFRGDGGGGGGGATYIFMMDNLTNSVHPIVIASGGGGLAPAGSKNESKVYVSPHGLPPNASLLPINGFTGPGAGGGGGWNDKNGGPRGGAALSEGGIGGQSCGFAGFDGGFGGGGGACWSGGGGGGYRANGPVHDVPTPSAFQSGDVAGCFAVGYSSS